jgi:Leucine-rich repeat (LRR) protein
MKKVYTSIISIILLLPLSMQAKSIREILVPPISDDNTLNLSGYELTSLEGLEDIPHPEAIQILDFEANQLESIPVGIFDTFVNLQRLYLSDNRLRELPVHIFDSLTQLIDVDLSDNQLITLDAHIFKNQTELDRLDLSNNHLRILPAEIFSTTRKLNFLDLNNNQLQELPEEIFSRLTQVQRVALANNKLNILRENTFKNTINLTSLDLSGNHVRTLPAGIFSTTRQLRALDFTDNKLQTLPQHVFSALIRLRNLCIGGNYLPGTQEEFKRHYLGNRELDNLEFKSEEQWQEEFFQYELLALFNDPALGQDNIHELIKELQQGAYQEEQPRVAILHETNGNTVLHRAIILRNLELVRELLRLWPHLLKVKNNGGRTPLHTAAGLPAQTKEDCETAYQLFMQILTRGRKHRDRLLTVKDNDGDTPIQLALKNNQVLIFEKLISVKSALEKLKSQELAQQQ